MLNTYDKFTLFQYFGLFQEKRMLFFLKKAFDRNIEIEQISICLDPHLN